jgi:hypothetical protein
VADLLNLAPRYLATGKGAREAAAGKNAYKVALSRRDAANGDERTTWEKVAAGLAKTALVVLVSIPPLLPSKAEASFNINSDSLHIAARWLRRLQGFLTFLIGTNSRSRLYGYAA